MNSVQAGAKCGQCLMDRVEVVALRADGTCPKCDPRPEPKDEPARIKYTAPVRRGFAAILAALHEDTDHELTDPQHWAFRSLDARSRKAALAALAWMEQEVNGQLNADCERSGKAIE